MIIILNFFETIISETNEPVEEMSNDSVWNFHVWNEIWVKGTGHWPEEYKGFGQNHLIIYNYVVLPSQTFAFHYRLVKSNIKAGL